MPAKQFLAWTQLASYNNPKGALCSECQELNVLHSQAVDATSVKIPEKLASPPPPPKDSEPFILDTLAEHVT
ncbi:hypothetical protein E1B28_005100 [Marasmius oreades]|uniref:Uncharacterized protein n=1 Tax=Marasmius oreades TaxID=181124 RepID=A0A9P8ADH1_9AGAR|nr:uncharacterized protein E1B28_005100 [Marasmius oreades]KAG7097781.1 hypothetical protein E1B28_005100 [Marasmius oreades]